MEIEWDSVVDRCILYGEPRYTVMCMCIRLPYKHCVRTVVYPVIIWGTPVLIRHNKYPLTIQTLCAYRGLPSYNSRYTCTPGKTQCVIHIYLTFEGCGHTGVERTECWGMGNFIDLLLFSSIQRG